METGVLLITCDYKLSTTQIYIFLLIKFKFIITNSMSGINDLKKGLCEFTFFTVNVRTLLLQAGYLRQRLSFQ